jgi:hypothetical protein
MTPSEFAYRVPSEQEVTRILAGAPGKVNSQTAAGKAKSNLLRSLDWAYTGLSLDNRNSLVYAGKVPLGQALQHKDTISDADVKLMQKCLVVKFTGLQHPGNSLKPLDTAQNTTITQLLQWFDTTNTQIAAKAYDHHLETVFPPDSDKKQSLDDRRAEVVKRLKKAHECAGKLLKENKIVVAGYHVYVNSGGGGGANSIDLKPDFFASYTDPDRRATIVHEATHTIPTLDMHTLDTCYIHQPQFSTLELAKRYLNASHFEALIRLINGETLKLATGTGPTGGTATDKTPTPKKLASEILTAAWIQAWRWHGEMAKEHQADTRVVNIKRGPGLDLIDQAHVLGLSWAKVEKGYFSTDVTISNSDLAFLENRAGKLGVLMGSAVIDKAADAITEKKDLAFTADELADKKRQIAKVENLLQTVIELEGALRKTSNGKKTLDMIMALADKKLESEDNTSAKPLVAGRYSLFLSTYPRIKIKTTGTA